MKLNIRAETQTHIAQGCQIFWFNKQKQEKYTKVTQNIPKQQKYNKLRQNITNYHKIQQINKNIPNYLNKFA
jgi:hypothetical protein